VLGQILRREQSVASPHVGGNGRGDRPGVERRRAIARQRVEAVRQVWVGEQLAHARRLAVGQERAGRGRIQGQPLGRCLPFGGHQLGHRKAVAGAGDGRRQRVGHRDRTEASEQRLPAAHHAGNVDRQRAAGWHLGKPPPGELGWGGRGRRAAAGVETVQALGLSVEDQREEIATDAVHRRLDDGEHSGGSDCGIDGVAARLQHLQAGGGGQRLTRGDHPARADRRRSCREEIAERAITGAAGSGVRHAWRPFYGSAASRIRDAAVRR
jgi:hypothetical protein